MGGHNPGFVAMARKRRLIVWQMNREWKVTYDDAWREIMREVSQETGIPVEDVERINTAWWRYMREMMMRVELPVIRMTYLGTMKPSVKKLYRYCEKVGEMIDAFARGIELPGKRTGDVGLMAKHLKKLQDTYFRLLEERKKKAVLKYDGMTPERYAELYRFAKPRRLTRVTMAEARKLQMKLLEQNTDFNNATKT